MKKRLLLGLMTASMAVSGFALEEGEYVYTPQGRFQITGTNVASSNFADWTGWTVVSATDKALNDNFTIQVTEGLGDGVNSAKSTAATADEGMYFKFEPASSATVYVVSYKMKATAVKSIRIKTDILKTNLVKVVGNTDGTYASENGLVTINKAEELSTEWKTFNYAIVPDENQTARTYFISFTGMATDIEIADLQIAPALQIADLRLRDAMLEKMKAYRDCYDWPASIFAEGGDYEGYPQAIAELEKIGDESSPKALSDALKAANDVLAEFLKGKMEDYFDANANNKLGIGGKLQSQTTLGDWTCLPAGRGYRGGTGYSDYPDMGHYNGSATWGETPYGVTMQKELTKGSYVFTIEGRAAFRENSSTNTWANDDGLKVGTAYAYITKVLAQGATPVKEDTIALVIKELDPLDYTPSIVSAKITEDGNYEIGYKVYCKYPSTKQGGVVYVANASLYVKNENIYTQKELAYEADVREQITTGRNELTKAAENLADETKFWGKATLQDSISRIEPLIAEYEKMTQEEIIETFDEEVYSHDNRTKEAGDYNDVYCDGLLVYEVYDNAVKGILAANRKFTAVNDTLSSLNAAIASAEGTMSMRIYSAATGKDALQTKIDDAKTLYTTLCEGNYSEENAKSIVDKNKELAEAIETFKGTVPGITEIISLDFSNSGTTNENGEFEIQGTNTKMTIANYLDTNPEVNDKDLTTNQTFQLGYYKSGAKVLADVLRIGNGSAVATIPTKDYSTNILRVSMDFWFIRITEGYAGFNLADEEGNRIAGILAHHYNNNLSSKGYDDFGIADKIGSYMVSNTSGNDASCADNNKTHIEVILDYGEKSMYISTTTPSGTQTSDKVVFNAKVPVTFNVIGDYSANTSKYSGRRSWFDNLKIEEIPASAAEEFVPSAIEEVAAPKAAQENAIYTINGVRVAKATKPGLYIINGRKVVIK